jgi:hypothetical protein
MHLYEPLEGKLALNGAIVLDNHLHGLALRGDILTEFLKHLHADTDLNILIDVSNREHIR